MAETIYRQQTAALDRVRSQFPALASGFAYLENAGGSQVPKVVADAVREHMLTDYVQLGAGYPQADRATAMVADAHAFMEQFVNAGDSGKVVLGPSCTALINLIAAAYGDVWTAGDEVIIAETNHEANAGVWQRLERRGISIKTWKLDSETFRCEPSELEKLLTRKTKIVAMPHVSNIVGQIEDVRKVCEMAHAVGAKVCADGVAFAPHRAIDVQAMDVDWYLFSAYKVYAPHLAVMYGKHEALAELTGPNHSFVPKEAVPAKWELGGISHEGCAGLLALQDYLGFVAEESFRGRSTILKAFTRMAQFESPAEERLREYLSSKRGVAMIGPSKAASDTVGTVSFVHEKIASDSISSHVNRGGVGIRHGNMYAVRLVDALGISRDPGVVRVSMVHYNTLDETERVIDLLERAFA